MVLGRKEIASEADRLNLRLGRQPAAAKSVHADGCARPAHLLQRRFHVVWIVGQRFNLLPGQEVSESVAPRIERAIARVLPDDDIFEDLGQRQPHLAPRVAASAEAHVVQLSRFEPWEFGADGISSRQERREDCVAALISHCLV